MCSKPKNTKYHIDGIDIITTINGYEATIYGKSDINIICGNLNINVWLRKHKIITTKQDLCHYTECPISINEPNAILISLNQTLPPGLYTIQVQMDSKCNGCVECTNLGCVEFSYQV